MIEYNDKSYNACKNHTCITCKCGTVVWYGYSKLFNKRPKYCSICSDITERNIRLSARQSEPDEQLAARIEDALYRKIPI